MRRLQAAIRDAPAGSNMARFGRLLAARLLLHEIPRWRRHVNPEHLDRQYPQTLSQTLAPELGAMRREASLEVGMGPAIDGYEAHLLSEDYQNRLRLMTPEEGQVEIAQHMRYLAAADPTRVERVGRALVAARCENELVCQFLSLPFERQESAIERAIAHCGHESAGGAARSICEVIRRRDPSIARGSPPRSEASPRPATGRCAASWRASTGGAA